MLLIFRTFFCTISPTGHIHQRKQDAPICSDFLLGKCKKDVKCPGHHCPLPFHWQYTVDGEWRSFSEHDNEELEKLYCDVTLEECSAKGFQISFERQVLFVVHSTHSYYGQTTSFLKSSLYGRCSLRNGRKATNLQQYSPNSTISLSAI